MSAAGARAPGPVVIKVGGEVVHGPHMGAIARDVATLAHGAARVPVVLVHGGGPQATALQRRLGQQPVLVAGRRVTDADALETVKMAVAGQVNVDLCAALLAAGAHPVGLHGASDGVVRAVKRPPRVVAGGGPDPIDFGHVGDVAGVNRELVALLLSHGYVPVVACLGASAEGGIFNINADIVANELAAALEARALVLVSDVPGVLRDVADPSSRIPRMTREEGKKAISDGTVTKGMIPKLEESFAAIAKGVRAVHVIGRVQAGDIIKEIETPGSVGTVLVA